MPKFYCDFCDVFLTHDTLNVRRSHNTGWKHKANVRAYYAQFLEQNNPVNSLLGQRAPNFNPQFGQSTSSTITQPVVNYQQQTPMSFPNLPPLPNLSSLPPLPNQQNKK
eukprot:gene11695-4929_t